MRSIYVEIHILIDGGYCVGSDWAGRKWTGVHLHNFQSKILENLQIPVKEVFA